MKRHVGSCSSVDFICFTDIDKDLFFVEFADVQNWKLFTDINKDLFLVDFADVQNLNLGTDIDLYDTVYSFVGYWSFFICLYLLLHLLDCVDFQVTYISLFYSHARIIS